MKKKIIIFALISIFSTLLITSYRYYARIKSYQYAKYFAERTQLPSNQLVITDDVQVEKIIKKTPLTLVLLITWDNNEKAYISIDNWMTKAHDKIEVHPIDKNKVMIIYE